MVTRRLVAFDTFRAWSATQKVSYLLSPQWVDRCDCDLFGFPWPDVVLVRTCENVHQRNLCQPSREYLDVVR